MNDAFRLRSTLSRRRVCVHGLCALILAIVAIKVFLDCRPSAVLAAQIPLSAPSAFVVYRPDGRTLVTESHNENTYTIDFWDAESGQSQGNILHASKLNTAAFSLDGLWLVTGGETSADVWNLNTRERLWQLETSTHEKVNHVAFSPNGQWIAAQSGTAITVWNAQTGQRVEQMDEGNAIAPDFAISPDSLTIAYLENEANADQSLCLWHLERSDAERCIAAQTTLPGRLRWSPDGQQLALGGSSGLWLWKLPDGVGQKVSTLSGTAAAIYDLTYGSVGPIVAMSDGALPVVIRSSPNGEQVASLGDCAPGVRSCHCHDLTFAPNGQALALQTIAEDDQSAAIQIWKPSAGHW